ncbi:MAG: Ca-activated chloride channel family protein [Kiritimatiellia bacterium]|jgi:Ca-activated chloride channel homolog
MTHMQRERVGGAGLRHLAVLGGLLAVFASTSFGSAPLVSCKVELDRAILPAGKGQKAVVKVSLNAVALADREKRAPVNVAIVLDRSGSMSGDKIRNARAAAIEALKRLGPDDIFSLVTYNHAIDTLVPAQRVKNVDHIIRQINGVTASGDTALFGGVSQAAAEVRKHLDPERISRIVLLSDGNANVGPHTPEDLGRLGASLIKEGISVSSVGVGQDYNEDLMTQLARRSDGNTYFVAESMDLVRIFSAEFGDALNVVAKQIKLVITFPESVHPVKIVGLDGRVRDDRVELNYNQLYGGQEKYAIVEVILDETIAGITKEIAQANVTYTDATSGRSIVVASTVQATGSARPEKVEASLNWAVRNAWSINVNAIGYDEAIEWADKGDAKKAADILNKSAQQLEQDGRESGDEQLIQKARLVKSQADDIEKQGRLSKYNRKLLRADGYQDLQQQETR